MTWIAKLPFYSSEHIWHIQTGFIVWRFLSNTFIGLANWVAVAVDDESTDFKLFIAQYGFFGNIFMAILYFTVVKPNTKNGRVSLSRSLWELVECNDFNGIQELIAFGLYFDFEQAYGYKGDTVTERGDLLPNCCLDREDRKDYSHQKPLEYAIEHNMVDMVRVLVENGARVTSSNVKKAMQSGNAQILQILSSVV